MPPSRYSVTPLLCVTLAVGVTGSALAQTSLPPVVVTAPVGRSAGGTLNLQGQTEVGSRLGLTLREQPGAVEIIPGEVIRERGDESAQEAVSRATGITAAGTPGDGSSALVSRGFAGNNSVMQLYDGTRLSIAANTLTFPVDTWLLDRIEVLRGPASVIHGVGAIGGAINYVPRQPLRQERVTDILLAAGLYDTYQIGVNSSGPLFDQAAYQIGIIGTTSHGYVDRGDLQRLSMASSLEVDITPQLKLHLAFDGTYNEPERYWGTPLNAGAIDTRFRDLNYNVKDSTIRYQDYWGRLRLEWRPAPTVTLRNEAYFLSADRYWRNLENYEFLPPTGQVLRTSYLAIIHEMEQFGNRLDARLDGTVLGHKYRVLVGFDVNQIDFQRPTNSPFAGESLVDAFDPAPGTFLNLAGTGPRLETRTTQAAFFAEGFLQVTEIFKLVAGVRFDSIDYTRKDLLTPANSFDKTFDPFTWRVGGVLDLLEDVTLYAQVTRGVDPLSSLVTLPLSQSDTRLTEAWQYEFGLKTRFLEGRGEATLAGYYIAKKNLLSPDPENRDQVIQIGEQTAVGFEGTLGLKISNQFAIDANIALLDAHFSDLTELGNDDTLLSLNGNQPTDVPEMVANLWVLYTPTPAWRLGAGLRHVGERFADERNTVSIPDYTLIDAFVTYAPTRLWNVTLRGRNLTDTDYAIAAYGPTQFILGQPINGEIAVNLRF